MNTEKLIRALRARGKSDSLAQWAADEIERRAPKPAPSPDGFIITERVRSEADKQMQAWRAKADAIYEAERVRNAELRAKLDAMPLAKPPAKKAPAKKAKR